MVHFVGRSLNCIRYLLKGYIILLMAALVALTFAQVLARYLMDSPFTSTDQLARIVLVWLTFMGAAAAIDQGQNVRIDSIEKLLPGKVRQILSVCFDFTLFILLVILTVKGYAVYLVGSFQTILGTPFSYQVMYSSLVVGTVLMALFTLVRALYKLGLLEKSWLGEVE